MCLIRYDSFASKDYRDISLYLLFSLISSLCLRRCCGTVPNSMSTVQKSILFFMILLFEVPVEVNRYHSRRLVILSFLLSVFSCHGCGTVKDSIAVSILSVANKNIQLEG
jgi:hypothetical protein